jgi:DnaJ-class molecular chaperone
VSDDPYNILGVAKDASADAIRKAYRKLAKELHPDINPGDTVAEERFKAVQAAYDLLKDPDKRARFDRGEIDASGQERAHPQYRYRDFADAGAGGAYHSDAGFGDMGDLGGIFADLFGGRRSGGRGETVHMRGRDVRYTFEVDFLDAVNGTRTRLTMPNAKALDLTIPPGLRDGQMLRLKGKGESGMGGAPDGDALVEVHVRPHKLFRRVGDDIELDLPVALHEAVLGGKVKVPTPDGSVTMTVPKGANTGQRLRLKGKGAPTGRGKARGDLYVVLHVRLPDRIDDDLKAAIERWSKDHAYDPRRNLKA